MVTFELSITNIVITAAILILAVLYVTVLLKLKPSTEDKDHKKDSLPEKRKPPQNGLIFVNSLKTKEKTTIPQGTQPRIDPQKIRHPLTMTVRPATSQVKNQEAPKQVARAENRSSNTHCAHHFGYLRKLPKSTPIPSECLGCPQVVECMTTLKVAKKLVKSPVAKS